MFSKSSPLRAWAAWKLQYSLTAWGNSLKKVYKTFGTSGRPTQYMKIILFCEQTSHASISYPFPLAMRLFTFSSIVIRSSLLFPSIKPAWIVPKSENLHRCPPSNLPNLVQKICIQRGVFWCHPSISYSHPHQIDLEVRDLVHLMDPPADCGHVPSPIGFPERVELVLTVVREEGEELGRHSIHS